MADKILTYTNFDFQTIKANIISLMQTDPIFKDYNFAGSNINTIIELISGVADLFDYYINAVANESFIESADLYENVNKLVELIGYNPGGYKAATLTIGLDATIEVDQDDDYFEIPKWTQFSVSDTSPEGETIKYINPSNILYIGSAGTNNFSDNLYLIQGVQEDEPFTGTGETFQRFEVTEEKAIEEYIEVVIDGVTWTKVTNLYRGIDDTSKVFTTRFNKNQRVEIQFGDGIFGVKPILNAVIVVDYIKTLGDDGSIGANTMTAIDSDIKMRDASTGIEKGDAISFTISQTDASDGGYIPLTVDQVRDYGPRAFRTQDRAVSEQDHEDLLLSYFTEFVLQSVTLNSDDYFTMTGETPISSGSYYNNVYLYILPRSGNTITGNLRQEILDFFEDYKMATINYVLKDIDYRNFIVDVTFKILTDTIRTTSEVQSDIESIIRNYFTRSERTIAEEIKYSELMSSLYAVDGVSSLTMTLSSDLAAGWQYENIQLGLIQFPVLDTLTITPSGTGV